MATHKPALPTAPGWPLTSQRPHPAQAAALTPACALAAGRHWALSWESAQRLTQVRAPWGSECAGPEKGSRGPSWVTIPGLGLALVGPHC